MKDPYVVLTGDFNQWRVEDAVQEFRDFHEVGIGPTRHNRCIDRTLTNMTDIIDHGTLSPLQTDDELYRESDHRTTFVTARLARREKYKWLSYSYRYNNEDSAKKNW